MTSAFRRFGQISIIAVSVACAPTLTFAQDDAAMRAQIESAQQMQSGAPGLVPNMGIAPSGPQNSPRVIQQPEPGPDPTFSAPEQNRRDNAGGNIGRGNLGDGNTGSGNTGGGFIGGRGNGGFETRGGDDQRGDDRRGRPRDDTFRNPDLDYRNRPPRWDDHNRNPRYRPPPVIVRPYFPPPVYIPPPVIVRPYVPPPTYYDPPGYYDPPSYYDSPRRWGGPVPGNVVWDLFPRDVYESLTISARLSHERAFVSALSSSLGQTQTWRWGNLRGEVTVIDESFRGTSFCRDVVQTIRTPWFARTVDGRACIRQGQSWRLVSY